MPVIIEGQIRSRTLKINSIPVLLELRIIFLPVVSFFKVHPLRNLILQVGTSLETPIGRYQHDLGKTTITQFLQNLVFHLLQVVGHEQMIIQPIRQAFLKIILLHLLLVGSINKTSYDVHLPLVSMSCSILEKEHTVNVIMHIEPVKGLYKLKDTIKNIGRIIIHRCLPEDILSSQLEPFVHQSFLYRILTKQLLIFFRQKHMGLTLLLVFKMFQWFNLYLMTARISSFNKLLELPAIIITQRMNPSAQGRPQILNIKIANGGFA